MLIKQSLPTHCIAYEVDVCKFKHYIKLNLSVANNETILDSQVITE